MSFNTTKTYPCHLEGDITETRARELMDLGYDSTASIENDILTFNDKKLQILLKEEIEEAVFELIRKEKFYAYTPSETIIPSQKETKLYIMKETKEGGELEFFSEIRGHEYDRIQIKDGIFATKLSISLYKWGSACFDLGVNTIEDAHKIFAEYKGRAQ